MYTKALEILKNHPVKALCEGTYQDKENNLCCAIGVIIPETINSPERFFRDVENHLTLEHPIENLMWYDDLVMKRAKELGLTEEELKNIQWINDYSSVTSPEERYQKIIEELTDLVEDEEDYLE